MHKLRPILPKAEILHAFSTTHHTTIEPVNIELAKWTTNSKRQKVSAAKVPFVFGLQSACDSMPHTKSRGTKLSCGPITTNKPHIFRKS